MDTSKKNAIKFLHENEVPDGMTHIATPKVTDTCYVKHDPEEREWMRTSGNRAYKPNYEFFSISELVEKCDTNER